jgi:carbon-monoxide dehydrogenase medium subunit
MRFRAYHRPKTIGECLAIKASYNENGVYLAGGTDLVPRLTQGIRKPDAVIDLSELPELREVQRKGNGVFIGAMEKLRSIQRDTRLVGAMSVLREGAGHVSSMQVRNIATLGGNVCNASPSADTVPAMLLLDTEVVLQGKNGSRNIALANFLIGPGQTDIRNDELLSGFFIRQQTEHTTASYHKYAIRGDSDIAIIGVGVLFSFDSNGSILKARIAIASAGPKAMRMKRAEDTLVGQMPSTSLFADVAELCREDVMPITDQRATENYRRDMVAVWTRNTLTKTAAKANAGKFPYL